MPATDKSAFILGRDDFSALLDILRSDGYTLLGPTVRDEAIVYDAISGIDDLPAGWAAVMKGAIAKNASCFNSHRMMRRYATEAYIR